ncbi:fungal-specific transcription factor domain-containing protein [Aspergillus ambiguus]|uniref:Zn(II)2Cys6 transcription factor n=1 Tax=Aspergillus ambiguus TaxID=176160 RepID=UPI003CCDB199
MRPDLHIYDTTSCGQLTKMRVSRPIAGRQQASSEILKRSAKACNRCRKRRTKCAGEPPLPCKGCRDSGHLCVYPETEKRVTVPESYLIELQNLSRGAIAGRVDRDNPTDLVEVSDEVIELGFTSTDNWVLSNSGQYYFMGNSSSTYIANRLNPTTENLDWHMYPHYENTTWLNRSVHPEIPPLPPFEVAKRLYRAQHAYIGTIFSFLSDVAFQRRLEQVYARSPDIGNREECLIYCQILLVFAFGQMYSINQWVDHDGPPGFQYFKHALTFIPSVSEDGSILFVEVLSYVAYFMQAINRRDTAYVYIGIALRMAITLGLHREVSDKELDDETREHRRRVWWSTYSMERLLCVTSGHPISIQDEDIDLLPPCPRVDEDGHAVLVLARYTELSRIHGVIGEKIYRKKQKSSHDLSACVQHIMKQLDEWFQQLPESMQLDPSDMYQEPSREVVSTHLHYYHCINMTARPILLYAIQRQLAANAQHPNAARWEDGFSPEIAHVIDTAISGARSSALILNTAAKYNHVALQATYGFIDGEQAFSAALLLVMVNIAFSYQETNASAMDMALGVLQMMAEKGNKYIQACHSLLSKIKSSVKTKDSADPAGKDAQTVERDHAQGDNPATEGAIVAGISRYQPPAFNLDSEGDQSLWADVLDSIDIGMDRQWVESALLRGQQMDGTIDLVNY